MNVEALLEPISPESPAGEWLRYEGTYDRIQEARREDDAALPQGIWKTAQKRANWQQVEELCQEALRTRSKDLQIAAWLLEAWLHQHGYRGLIEGLRLLHGLCERFWDYIYPILDPDEPGFRTAPFEWIDRKIPLTLKLTPLTQPEGTEGRAYSYSDWEVALYREQEAQRTGAKADDEAPITRARFMASVSLTPRPVLLRAGTQLDEALASVAALEALLDERLGWRVSAFLELRETIRQIRHLVSQVAGTTAEPRPDGAVNHTSAPVEEQMQSPPDDTAEPRREGGPIRSRAEAYQRLQEAADYLLRTEPHSPAPYLVKRAVSWGNKTLAELLREIVGSEQDLRSIYQLLGIRGGE